MRRTELEPKVLNIGMKQNKNRLVRRGDRERKNHVCCQICFCQTFFSKRKGKNSSSDDAIFQEEEEEEAEEEEEEEEEEEKEEKMDRKEGTLMKEQRERERGERGRTRQMYTKTAGQKKKKIELRTLIRTGSPGIFSSNFALTPYSHIVIYLLFFFIWEVAMSVFPLIFLGHPVLRRYVHVCCFGQMLSGVLLPRHNRRQWVPSPPPPPHHHHPRPRKLLLLTSGNNSPPPSPIVDHRIVKKYRSDYHTNCK